MYIRGGDYDQVGYEFDGVPVNRSFDNYPSSSASSLGNAEVQIYTGRPRRLARRGLAGYINQVIRTGTYPGFADGQLGIGPRRSTIVRWLKRAAQRRTVSSLRMKAMTPSKEEAKHISKLPHKGPRNTGSVKNSMTFILDLFSSEKVLQYLREMLRLARMFFEYFPIETHQMSAQWQ